MALEISRTLADIAGSFPHAVRILEDRGLDYCCGGKLAFDDACRNRGLDPAIVAAEIEAAGEGGAAGLDWREATLTGLVHHIVDRHHRYLEMALPTIAERLKKVTIAHGARDGALLAELTRVFDGLRDELEIHTKKEEDILFPWIERMESTEDLSAEVPMTGSAVLRPIAVMEAEHESAGEALAQIRRLTNGFDPPEHACATYRALYASLAELESDLHLHIHLENNILFPRAAALDSGHRQPE